LLDEVLEWNVTEIMCRTGSHRLSSNPLRTAGHLKALCAIEYAAQAIAVHGAVNSSLHGARPGMLASVRAVDLHVDRLDDVEGDLMVRALRIGGDETALLYEFGVSGRQRMLASGRGTIILRPSGSTPQSERSAS
jgi:predicted hotdog family 3-hydroxylacyl-ACP dehydratase